MIPGRPQGIGFAESFGCAVAGIRRVAAGRNFRVQCCVGLVAVILGLCLRLSSMEWVAVITCIGLVLGGECVNTALENAVDLACDDKPHPLAKASKDAAAGAVLLFSVASLLVGIIIYLPKLLQVF